MRKVTVFVIACWIAIVLSGCTIIQTADSEKMAGESETMQDNTSTAEHNVNIGDSINSIKTDYKDNVLLDQYSCIAWMDPKGYNIACLDKNGDTIRAIVKFSENLELLEAIGVEPIEAIDQEEWVGKKETDFISKYGSCHFDYGSGAYIPSYISENGIIYFLHVFNDTINSISYFSPNGHSQGQFVFLVGIDKKETEMCLVTQEADLLCCLNHFKIVPSFQKSDTKTMQTKLFEWLQDLNWPGALIILDRLNHYRDSVAFNPPYNECMKRAVLLEDEIWEENLKLIKRETT